MNKSLLGITIEAKVKKRIDVGVDGESLRSHACESTTSDRGRNDCASNRAEYSSWISRRESWEPIWRHFPPTAIETIGAVAVVPILKESKVPLLNPTRSGANDNAVRWGQILKSHCDIDTAARELLVQPNDSNLQATSPSSSLVLAQILA